MCEPRIRRCVHGHAEDLEVGVTGVPDHQLAFGPSPDGDFTELQLPGDAECATLRDVGPVGVAGRVRERCVTPQEQLAITHHGRVADLPQVGLSEFVRVGQAVEVAVGQSGIIGTERRFGKQRKVVYQMGHRAIREIQLNEIEPESPAVFDQSIRKEACVARV